MRGAGGGRPASSGSVNRNKPVHDWVTLPRAGRTGAVPKPTVKLEGGALRLWRSLWVLPEATMWTDADLAPITRMVSLQANPQVWMDSKLLVELRQLEDRYGLNPVSRRTMHWRYEDEPEEVAETASTVRRLRAVDPNTAAG